LRAELYHSDRLVDEYKLNVGLRWVEVRDGHLLLNGEPVFLRGFNKHEDFPILGKGLCHPLNIRDYDLMRWCGANSYRTSHYPYAEEMMDLADRLGFLVIDEIPAVGLWFGGGWERRLELCMQQITELIDRDKNHPTVIMWSVANEPHSRRPVAKEFFRRLIERARSLDSTRPVTLVSAVGLAEEALEYCDVACINRYYGWYSECGQIERGVVKLEEDLRAIHQRYGKPIILSEFGADAVHGLHTQPAEMFSEEYQAQMLERYLDVTGRLPFVIGQHIWNFADFKTGQNITRVGALNRKGVFTRDRQPKMAAHMLRRRWT
jgi:beta-glucuronidase